MSQNIVYTRWRKDKPREPGFSHELISEQFYEQFAHITDPDAMNLLPNNQFKTLYSALKDLERRLPNKNFLGTKVRKPDGGIDWEWITVKDVAQASRTFASGLTALNLIPDRQADGKTWRFVAIQAKNRFEWHVTHLANMHCKTTTVGLYDSLGENETRYIVNQTELATICCSKEMVKRHLGIKLKDNDLEPSQQKYSTVKNIISYDNDVEMDVLLQADKAGVKIYTYDQVITEGERSLSDFVVQEPDEEDVFTISYTSGTTGDPKGVKVNHRAMMT